MRTALLLAAGFLMPCATARAADPEPDLACPPGTRLVEKERDASCETPAGVGEGPFFGRYEDGTLRYHATARDGQTHGTWTDFHPNGGRAKQAEYVRGELTGLFRQWDANGVLRYEGTHDRAGEMHGTWTRYHPNGRKRLEWSMRHGVQHGPVAAWYADGVRKLEGQRRHGRQDGEWTWWDERGRVTQQCRFEAGRVVEGACPDSAP